MTPDKDNITLLNEIKQEEISIRDKCERLKTDILSRIQTDDKWIASSARYITIVYKIANGVNLVSSVFILFLIRSSSDVSSSVPSGRFDNAVIALNNQLRNVSEQLVGTLKDLESKVNSLNSTVTVIDNWKASQRENTIQQQQQQQQQQTGHPLPVKGFSLQGTSAVAPPSSSTIQQVIDHLS